LFHGDCGGALGFAPPPDDLGSVDTVVLLFVSFWY